MDDMDEAAERASKSKAPEILAILQWFLILGSLYELPYTNAALTLLYGALVGLGILLVVILLFLPRIPTPKTALRAKVLHLSTLLQLLIFSSSGNTTLVILLLALEVLGVIVVWQSEG